MSRQKPTLALLVSIVALLLVGAAAFRGGIQYGRSSREHISGFAWNNAEWSRRARGVRTSYNPDHELNTETLTLVPGDERWLDFVFWCVNNKLAEHQVEAYGGTEWDGPTGGVIFHWAPGSRWETDTLASFGFTIGHTIGEHRWMDTMFPDFFEKYGGVHGVNVKDRLAEIDPSSPKPWVEFLEYCGGSDSPYYRYLFHQEAAVDAARERIYLMGGQGVAFEYTFERFYHEVREVLTDAKAFQFFQLYDIYGPGFACRGGWAKNKLSPAARGLYFPDDESKWPTQPGVAKPVKYDPNPPSPPLPEGIPELEAVRRGQTVYRKQCAMCHGILGDGSGFLAAGLDVRPRDFRQGWYKFRSTNMGQLPTFEDLERIVRVGVPNTSMPAWGQFLTQQEISDVSRYLATFSERFTQSWQDGQKPELLPITSPPANLAGLTERGAQLYKTLGCVSCHGEKGNAPAPPDQKDSWGFPVGTADLTYKWIFKNGYSPGDLYRTVYGGLNGSSMPSAVHAVPAEDDRWALVSYVLAMSPETRPVLRQKDFKKLRSVVDENGIVRN